MNNCNLQTQDESKLLKVVLGAKFNSRQLHWPKNNEDLDEICYPDPSDHDYVELFELYPVSRKLSGIKKSSQFLVNRLYLNRLQLIYERREQVLKERDNHEIEEILKLLKEASDYSLAMSALVYIGKMKKHSFARDKVPPYKLVEIRNPKNMVESLEP